MDEMKKKGPPMPPKPQPLNADQAGPMPVIDEKDILDEVTADIVIIGLGHGGMQCALAAAEGGASVAVIEKKPEQGFRWTGEQIGTLNSQFFIDKGYGPYDLDEVIQEFMRDGGYYVNQDMINAYVKNSGEMLDHMISLVPEGNTVMDDDQYTIQLAYGDAPYPRVYGGVKSWPGTLIFRGTLVTEPYVEGMIGSKYFVNELSRLTDFELVARDRALELGAKIFYEQSGVVLTKDGERVSGVIAKDRDGGYHKYTANRAVVLCTGDGVNGGMNLGLWAGGCIEEVPVKAAGPQELAKSFGQAAFLHLNADGKRFVNESIPYAIGYACYRQPCGTVCSVFDSKWTEQIKYVGTHHGAPDWGVPLYIEQAKEDMAYAPNSKKQPVGIRSLSSSEREQWPVYAANSLEELADLLGYEGEARKNWFDSIARYNELCYKGYDDDYGKDPCTLIPIDEPPFYAGKATNSRGPGFGGLNLGFMVTSDMQIRTESGAPIPGLYAAGNCIGGRHALYYPTPVAGNHIGTAMTLGRVLGKKLTGQPVK